ncbi:MAG: acetyl-CoA hydrolase [Rhizobiales bacterium]|nr:acetyl-CoA hydrolase [Hyphomicrobiales bacterium]
MTFTSNDPARCAEAIVGRVGRDIRLAIPIGIGKPVLLVNALYRLAEADRSIRLNIFTGLSLARPRYRTSLEERFAKPLLDRLFASYPDLDYTAALRAGTLPPNVEVTEFFLQAGAWLGNANVQQHYTSLNYSRVGPHLERIGTNVMAQLVAPEPHGGAKLSLSSNTDVTLDLMPYIARRRRQGKPIVFAGELNANLPYMPGEAELPRDDFDVLVEPPYPHYDLFATPKEPVSLADYAMALHAATLIEDGGTLQLGIGSFADALAHALILRHTRNAEFRALLAKLGTQPSSDAELEPFRIGLYGCTEMLVDAFLALRRAGILHRRVTDRSGRSAVLHAGFFVGNQAFYRELREMPDQGLADIAMTSISFTNTLDGDEALKREQRRGARFVNTAMTVTLLGAASSDMLEDGRVVSGAGGQHDLAVVEGGAELEALVQLADPADLVEAGEIARRAVEQVRAHRIEMQTRDQRDQIARGFVEAAEFRRADIDVLVVGLGAGRKADRGIDELVAELVRHHVEIPPIRSGVVELRPARLAAPELDEAEARMGAIRDDERDEFQPLVVEAVRRGAAPGRSS